MLEEAGADLVRITPNVFASGALRSSPLPHLAKGPRVKQEQKADVQRVDFDWSAPTQPSLGAQDVLRLDDVEVAAGGDVGQFEALRLIRVQRCRAYGRAVV